MTARVPSASPKGPGMSNPSELKQGWATEREGGRLERGTVNRIESHDMPTSKMTGAGISYCSASEYLYGLCRKSKCPERTDAITEGE